LPLEKDHTLLFGSFRELDGKLFAEMQNWALQGILEKTLTKQIIKRRCFLQRLFCYTFFFNVFKRI